MPVYNPPPSGSTDTTQIEARLGEISTTPTANSLSDRLLQILARFGTIGDINSATGTLIARIGAFASNIGIIVTNFGAIADASSATGSLLARIRAIAADITSLVAATSHPSAANRTSVLFVANTAQTIVTAVGAGVRWRTVSIRSLKTNSTTVFVALGSATATIADATVEIEAGGFYETYHLGAISAISGGTPTIVVTTQP